ncbi:hypothetical protein ACQP00_25225 [Dactylosporangium sp. CS-047395]|uniref:hypothetical protein n=1 Tax=Dactylosporangium sp. CS-047395 TaxID=3239936 RepID=UPI003D8F0809
MTVDDTRQALLAQRLWRRTATPTVPNRPTGTVPNRPTGTVPNCPTGTVPNRPTGTVPNRPTGTVPPLSFAQERLGLLDDLAAVSDDEVAALLEAEAR